MSARNSASSVHPPGSPCPQRAIRRIRLALALVATGLMVPGVAPAQTRVVRDGTVGPGASIQPGTTVTATGVEVQIGESLGERHGANLFHSFQFFDVGTGDGVHFSADPGLETDHVISRVTGGDPSNILGQIRSSIPGADVYLLNPAGVFFGDGATLDVDGSFRVSTADTLVLGGDGLFTARPDLPSLLRSAPPSAFGFLDGAGGSISVDGAQLGVEPGRALWLSGTDVDVAGAASLEAPGGSVAAIAVGDVATRVGFDSGSPDAAPELDGATGAGRVGVGPAAVLDASASEPGAVYVEAGQADLRGRLAADNLGDGRGGRVDVRVGGPLTIGGVLSADTLAEGDAGQVAIGGRPQVALETGALLSARSIPTGGGAGGDAGVVALEVDRLHTAPDSRIDVSSAPGSGAAAGQVEIDARHTVRLAGTGQAGLDFGAPDGVVAGSGVLAGSQGGGRSGSIAIRARRVVISDGATVSTASLEGGGGGRIEVAASNVSLRSGGSLDASTLRGDRGGDIDVRAGAKLAIRGADANGLPSQIRALTAGPGEAGSVILRAGRLEMSDAGRVATLALPVFGDGDAGRIRVEADSVRLRSGAEVNSSTFGRGDAGRIQILGPGGERASRVVLADAGTRVIGKTAGGGDGAEIEIRSERVKLRDGASLSTRSASGLEGAGSIVSDLSGVDIDGQAVDDTLVRLDQPDRRVRGDGGVLGIDASRSLRVRDATIESVATSRGDAGQIEIGTPRMRIEQGGNLTASTSGRGDGGQISIGRLERLKVSGGSAIEASSLARRADGAGDAGSIRIAGVHDGRVAIEDGRIETSSRGSGGGRISIALDGDIALDGARIETDVREGESKGGDIILRARSLAANDSVLRASATEGNGGAIEILVSDFQPSSDTIIESTSERGFDGRVRVRSPDSLVANTRVVPLDVEPPDPVSLLRRACSARRTGRAAGELVVLPADADDLGEGLSFAWAPAVATPASRATAGRTARDEAQRIAAVARAAALRDDRAAALADLARLGAALENVDGTSERVVLEIHAAGTRARLAQGANETPDDAKVDLLAAYELLNDAARRAAKAGDDRLRSYATGHLAELYRRQARLDEALFLARRARAAAERAEAADAVYRWSWLEGRVQWERGHAGEAIAALRRSVAAIELGVPVATRFRSEIAPVYLDLVSDLLDTSDRVPDPAERKRLLREARATMERLKVAELRDYFRDECVAALESKTVTLDALSEHAAIVYPIVLPDRLELLVSLRGEITRYSVAVGSPEVLATARRFRAGVENRLSNDYLQPARQLYDWLVRPYIASVTASGVDTLVFVPDGELAAIPLAALHGDGADLSERFALAVEPGLALLDPRPLRRDNLRPVLAGLSETIDGFAPLVQVPDELAAIHALYGGEVLLNDDFRIRRLSTAVASRRPALLHVASHMTFTGDPSTSFLLAHDGRMSLEEFAAIVGQSRFQDEPVELLMLSACETAAGDGRAALGLAGMAVRAGARSVVGSLWTVDDESARALVVEFYRQLRDPSVGRAEALRRAQQSLRREPRWSHPYYWSGFLMISDWQ